MTDQSAPELPAEVLERIFSTDRPRSEPAEPLLDAKQRLRSQLVSKAWRHALDVSRWPLRQLRLAVEAGNELLPEAPAAALWAQRVRPAVQQLQIELGGRGGYLDEGKQPLTADSPAVQAVRGALLALQPHGALCNLSLAAPFPVLECFLSDLGRFTGLRQLQLRAEMTSADDEEKEVLGWDVKAVLRLPLLAHLPPQLGSLELRNFYSVGLVEAGAPSGEAGAAREGAAGSTRPAQLLARLTRLSISRSRAVLLIMPLPSLRALTIQECSIVSMAHKWLRLPQLTSLRLDDGARVRCAAMPELARLSCRCHLDAVDSFSALRQLSHLELNLRDRQRGSQLVTCVAPSLRSLSVQLPLRNETLAREACRALAAAGASQLTRLEINSPYSWEEISSLACLPHLAAWPHLQELLLRDVQPTRITAEHVALLAAAPSLRRLAFSQPGSPADDAERHGVDEQQRMEELRQALPSCVVELC